MKSISVFGCVIPVWRSIERRMLVLLMLVLAAISSCVVKREDVVDRDWKYGRGYYIGDVLCFDENHTVVDDSLYIVREGMRIARITSVSPEELFIETLDGGKEGKYRIL